MSNERKIVAFHIGRGGRFNNPGYLRFIGEKKIGDFTDDLYPDYENRADFKDRLGWDEEYEEGVKCILDYMTDRDLESLEKYYGITEDQLGEYGYFKGNGSHSGLYEKQVDSGIGRINIDNDYDTIYTAYLDECSDSEINAIIDSNVWNKEDLLDEYAESVGFSDKEIKLMRHFDDYKDTLIFGVPTFKYGERAGYVYGEAEYEEHESDEDLDEKYLEIDGKFYTKL
jgi:hypothetical protein